MAPYKKLSKGATACLFHYLFKHLLQQLRQPFFVIVSNLMIGTPGKGDKTDLQNN